MNDIIFIIPTIGRKSLKQSIQSIINLNGDYKWKVLVLFDGIKNNIETIKHENIIFIEISKCGKIDKKNNAGLVRNKGFEYILHNNIETKYIGFLDDDDCIHPDYVINLVQEEKNFEFDCIIFRMMYCNYNIVPHPLTNKIERKNVGISFAIKKELISKYQFTNNPFEDFIFIYTLKRDKVSILLSKFVNYFVKTDFEKCKKYIKKYPNILFN